jgi:hypothetical protein
MMLAYAVRYFHIVPVVPPLMNVAFGIAVAAAALRLVSDASAAIDALTPLLVLQLFVASSGFRFAARRGYYDLLLTSGTPRWHIAFAHCLVSIMPGMVSWICVAIVEFAVNGGTRCTSVSLGACTAFTAVSLIAWSLAVFSSRTATAVLWLLVTTIPGVARVISPVRVLGASWATDRVVLVTVCCTTVVVFVAAMASIVRGAVPLEAAQ